MNYKVLTFNQTFLYLTIAMFTLFLAYSEFFKNLSLALMLAYLLYQFVNNKLTITKDVISISLISHLLVVIIGIFFAINSQEALAQSSDILKITIVFFFFREVDLSFISLEFIVRLVLIGFILTIFHSLVDYYIFHSDFLKLHSVGSINRSATYIMYIFVITLVLRDFFKSKPTQILLFAGLVLSSTALILAGSRMTMFSIPVVIAYYLLLQGRLNVKHYLFYIAPFLMLFLLYLIVFSESRVSMKLLQGLNDPHRIQIWVSSIYAWLEHNLLFGIGVGNSIFIDVRDYYDNALTANINNTHQLYLDMLLERGILGFFTFFTFIGSLWLGVRKEHKVLLRLLIFSLCLMGFANITFRYEFALLFIVVVSAVLNSTLKKEYG